MPVHLYLAPAAAGKTTYVLDRAYQETQGLRQIPHVCLPTSLQIRAWRRRLAQVGGAIGVRLGTFEQLYAECLHLAGHVYTELSEPVQYRLIRAIVDDLHLQHYAPLVARPGFIQVLQQLIAELKGAQVHPQALGHAVAALGDEPRLRELAQVYGTYQERLQTHEWADRAGMGWLALVALDSDPDIARDWPLLIVDGFDNFTPVQLALLQRLSDRVRETIITLTGSVDDQEQRFVHRRFAGTRQQLEQELGVQAERLPMTEPCPTSVCRHLELNLFRGKAERVAPAGQIELVEAPDRAGEVRAALRWLKARLVEDHMQLSEIAVLARDVPPYRAYIRQTAAEFGLPIRLVDGLPLRTNPAIAALLDLLRLMLPLPGTKGEPTLSRRLVTEAWRSPYFAWSALPSDGATIPIGIGPGDADALGTAARWGRVTGGYAQWEEVLTALTGRATEIIDAEDRGRSAQVPAAPTAQALLGKFRRFVRRLTPPPQARHIRDFVAWLEELIGPDPTMEPGRFPLPEAPTSLQVVACARAAAGESAELDIAALQTLKDVLRGLVWAAEAVQAGQAVDFPHFFADLSGAIEATAYHPPAHPHHEQILVANVIRARGIPLRAAAILGLAESEFPTTLSEDPFLRDIDRRQLRETFGLPLELSTESAEAEYFYEAIARVRERLLLTRPRLADNGAPWQASPYWEEVLRLVDTEPVQLSSESLPLPGRAASWNELVESLARYPGHTAVEDWVERTAASRKIALDAAAQVLHTREENLPDSPFNGNLQIVAAALAQRFDRSHTWSASRLESYRTCPFLFFVAHVLHLEPRVEMLEGLDVRQLGNIYHRIFEQLYREVSLPNDLDQLLAALPSVAGRILDEAPRQEGFRVTAWWAQTRLEIEGNVRRSLQELALMQEEFVPRHFEMPFGLKGQPPLVIDIGEDALRLRGYIDRIDCADDGRVRVIDYKTSGPSGFTPRAVADGSKLQLPLYARAARDTLGLGEIAEGFYWHVRHARPSALILSRFPGGVAAVLDLAVEKAWEAVRGVRQGYFCPTPPSTGCPSYCPASTFCWRHDPGFRNY